MLAWIKKIYNKYLPVRIASHGLYAVVKHIGALSSITVLVFCIREYFHLEIGPQELLITTAVGGSAVGISALATLIKRTIDEKKYSILSADKKQLEDTGMELIDIDERLNNEKDCLQLQFNIIRLQVKQLLTNASSFQQLNDFLESWRIPPNIFSRTAFEIAYKRWQMTGSKFTHFQHHSSFGNRVYRILIALLNVSPAALAAGMVSDIADQQLRQSNRHIALRLILMSLGTLGATLIAYLDSTTLDQDIKLTRQSLNHLAHALLKDILRIKNLYETYEQCHQHMLSYKEYLLTHFAGKPFSPQFLPQLISENLQDYFATLFPENRPQNLEAIAIPDDALRQYLYHKQAIIIEEAEPPSEEYLIRANRDARITKLNRRARMIAGIDSAIIASDLVYLGYLFSQITKGDITTKVLLQVATGIQMAADSCEFGMQLTSALAAKMLPEKRARLIFTKLSFSAFSGLIDIITFLINGTSLSFGQALGNPMQIVFPLAFSLYTFTHFLLILGFEKENHASLQRLISPANRSTLSYRSSSFSQSQSPITRSVSRRPLLPPQPAENYGAVTTTQPKETILSIEPPRAPPVSERARSPSSIFATPLSSFSPLPLLNDQHIFNLEMDTPTNTPR
ncbi:MAG: hypothetical protein K0S08_1045 [Gammaproteobacteria bacterium]|jgi:hypothetical protein|nr:hypothetical protein [Gammaproteobacteria bacterium]